MNHTRPTILVAHEFPATATVGVIAKTPIDRAMTRFRACPMGDT